MKETIKDMIEKAIWYYEQIDRVDEAYELIRFVRELIDKFAETINCPSNWRDIGTELATVYKDNSWVFDELELWNYKED